MVSGVYYAHIGWFLNDTKYDRVEVTNPSCAISGPFPKSPGWIRYFFVPPVVLAAVLFLAAACRGWSGASACRR
jgi:hypothetical protein